MNQAHEQQHQIWIAEASRRDEIRVFVLAMMKDLYPAGSYQENPMDLACFEEVYDLPFNARFWLAEDGAGQMIGTIAVRPYDGRFPEVQPFLSHDPVCEIAKCYIAPECRRSGVGSRLYEAAEQFAREAGYGESYLHTSLHLPGGYPFWKSRGYADRYWESNEIVHMSNKW